MYGEVAWPGDDGLEAQEQTRRQLLKTCLAEARTLPKPQGAAMGTLVAVIVPTMADACGMLFRLGLLDRLDTSQPLSVVCATGADLLKDKAIGDETFQSARLTFQGIGLLLEALRSAPLDPAQLVRAGIVIGGAEVRLTQVATGLWNVMADAIVNEEMAKTITKVRRAGGEARARQKKEAADAWKKKALAHAIKREAERPNLSRDQMAMEIGFQFEGEVPGHKAIEEWLRQEAEQPNGPLRSRTRAKSK